MSEGEFVFLSFLSIAFRVVLLFGIFNIHVANSAYNDLLSMEKILINLGCSEQSSDALAEIRPSR